ncbi:DUF192 domain-containing protein [Candidatus Parcubacteria bacterium]|nr:DUF192 domain-containing protein [Candidatus Parcubacteria bacterium]
MKPHKFFVAVLVVGIGLFGWYFLLKEKQLKKLKINNTIIFVEINTKKRQFFSKESFGEKEGILFVFEKPDVRSFDLKRIYFPLDFIWISGNEVVAVTENINSKNFSNQKIISSPVPVDKVLQVESGFVQKYQIKVGQKIEILD